MEVPLLITIVVTIFSPYATAVINRVTWSSETKNLVAIAVSLVIAVAYLAFTGAVTDWSDLTFVAPAVYGLQQAVYNMFLRKSATKVEAATTKGAVIIAPTPDPNDTKVTIASNQTIEDHTHEDEVDPPLRITATGDGAQPLTDLHSTTPAKG